MGGKPIGSTAAAPCPNGGYARTRPPEIGALRTEVVDHVSIKSADESRVTKSAGVNVGTRTPPLEFIASS